MRSARAFFPRILAGARQDPETIVAVLDGLWPTLAGETVAAHSRPVGLQRNMLLVETTSGDWTRQLADLESVLVDKVNQFWEAEIIDRIEFKSRLRG